MKNIKILSLFAVALVAFFGVKVGSANAQIASTTLIVQVTGSPTLELSYDSSKKESNLTAKFSISVTNIDSAKNVYVYKTSAGVGFLNQRNTQFNARSIGGGVLSLVAPVPGDTQYLYIIPAGSYRNFQVTSTANPRELFAGTYHASLSSLLAEFDTLGKNVFYVNTLNKNTTNSVVIVGELSPYISNFGSSQPFVPGQSIVVQGQRLSGSNAYIDGLALTASVYGDSSSVSFALPTSLTNGYHTLQLQNNTTGSSNNVSFQVKTANPCYVFSANLQIGSTGVDVVALQTFLIAKGFPISDLSLGGSVDKGYFGQGTFSALKAYQASVSIPATGFFGPSTRMKIDDDCNTVPTVPSINILSPNGGEEYKIGDIVNIKWNSKNFGSLKVQLSLLDKYGVMVPGNWLNLSNIPNTGSYLWAIPNGIIPSGTSGAFKILASSLDKGPSASDSSDSYFSISAKDSTSTNKPPIISGGTFPSLLKVNEVGTWLINASDPENGPLSYSVDWGDYICPPGFVCTNSASTTPFVQTSTFTHSYSSAGIYTIKFIIKDNIGQIAQTSTTVKVESVGNQIISQIDPYNPPTKTVVISPSTETDNVALMTFDLKSQNQNANLVSLKLQVLTDILVVNDVFSDIKIKIGSLFYSATSITGNSKNSEVVFTNMLAGLPADSFVPVTVYGRVRADLSKKINGTRVSVSLPVTSNTIYAINANYTNVPVLKNILTSNDTIFSTYISSVPISISNTSAIKTQDIVGVTNGPVLAIAAAYTFTLTNNSQNSLYVSSNVSKFINGTSTVPAGNTISNISYIEPMASIPGDGSGYYILPAGASRNFTVSGIIGNSGNTVSSQRLSITSIQYGTMTSGTGSSITSGLENLTMAAILSPKTTPVTPTCPAGYICYVVGGTTPVCPSGYTCNVVTANCPSGYTCTTNTPTTVTTPVLNNNREAVRQLYITLLYREPDQQGWDYWSNYSASIDVIKQLIMNGIEYKTKQQINNLYLSLLNHSADMQGMSYWYNIAAANNFSVDKVRLGIMSSEEYKSLTPIKPSSSGASVTSSIWDAVNSYFQSSFAR